METTVITTYMNAIRYLFFTLAALCKLTLSQVPLHECENLFKKIDTLINMTKNHLVNLNMRTVIDKFTLH